MGLAGQHLSMPSFVALAALVLRLCGNLVTGADGTADCGAAVSDFTIRRLRDSDHLPSKDVSKMLFFVHIPRTAGAKRCYL